MSRNGIGLERCYEGEDSGMNGGMINPFICYLAIFLL